MKVFIIHSGKDKPLAKIYKKLIVEETKSEVLVLNNGGLFWRCEASKLIKQANIVLFLIGEKSHESKYIGWEIKRCLRYNKPIYCLNLKNVKTKLGESVEEDKALKIIKTTISTGEDQYKIHKALTEMNGFTKEFQYRFLVKPINSINEFTEKIQKYINNEYPLFNIPIEQMNSKSLLEQYKIYLSTSESLVSRRQNVSSFYVSVNAAIISTLTLVSPFINNLVYNSIAIIVISIFGIILDLAWMRILDSYAILNSSKMKIIEMIEQRLPANIYDNEWAVMSDKLNNKKYISFTESEKRIPKVFCAIYVLAFLVFTTLLILTLVNVL